VQTHTARSRKRTPARWGSFKPSIQPFRGPVRCERVTVSARSSSSCSPPLPSTHRIRESCKMPTRLAAAHVPKSDERAVKNGPRWAIPTPTTTHRERDHFLMSNCVVLRLASCSRGPSCVPPLPPQIWPPPSCQRPLESSSLCSFSCVFFASPPACPLPAAVCLSSAPGPAQPPRVPAVWRARAWAQL
jgi:hypothetical protein